ncbi:MAG: polynucleotide adenylyltransferase PcnB [Betaproteobacteria bacterium]|nr:polynucleotide adenylyltransferase PcnB [Betaproteobacteria bacterium]
MLKKLIKTVRSLGTRRRAGPTVIEVSEHGMKRAAISSAAQKVTHGLQERGYKAYVVGGAVRDSLAGLRPKDFDIATDATPEQVKAVFRRARIIGRRFRLMHVPFGEEVVEVSTFRGSGGEGGDARQIHDEHGRIVRDNVFGSQEEDALRRDFTVNALFYDPSTEQIIDYCKGYADVRARRIRIIGDPEVRFREDPVRMLRAVRMAAKLDGKIDPATKAPISQLAELMANVPPARLFEEMLKLLLSGHGQSAIAGLRAEGLHHGLLPMLDMILEQPLGERFVNLVLARTDDRVQAGKSVSPGFLFAALLWHEVLSGWRRQRERGMPEIPALNGAMDDVIDAQVERLAIPRRFTSDMKELWSLQARFESRSGQRPYRLLEHARYRAAYDFLLLRAEAGEVEQSLADWWTRFQDASSADREGMLQTDTGPRKRRRRRHSGERVDTADQPSTT